MTEKPIVVSANLKFHMQANVPVDLREVILDREAIEQLVWRIAHRDRVLYLQNKWPCALATVRDGREEVTFSLFLPTQSDKACPVVEVSWDDHPLWHERSYPSPAILRISTCHSDGLTEVVFSPDTVVEMSVSAQDARNVDIGFTVSAWKRSDGGISLEWRWGTKKTLAKSGKELPDLEVAILSDEAPFARVTRIRDMQSSLLVAAAQDEEERVLVLYHTAGLWLYHLSEHIPAGY